MNGINIDRKSILVLAKHNIDLESVLISINEIDDIRLISQEVYDTHLQTIRAHTDHLTITLDNHISYLLEKLHGMRKKMLYIKMYYETHESEIIYKHRNLY